MKTTLDREDVEFIARRVAEIITPLLSQVRPDNDPIFDVNGLAEYLHVGKQYIYQRIHAQTIPFYKLGKYPRFKKSAIDEWLNQTAVHGGKKR